MLRVTSVLLLLLFGGIARGETVILKDGTFIEGTITTRTPRTIRVKTRFGTRTYSRRDIDRVVETVDRADPDAVNRFADLSPVLKVVLNARADYDLGNYERALKRLEPYRTYKENRAVRIRIDWLIIDLNERLGRWEIVRELLEDKREHGTVREKTRAKAHLDIFESNPDYGLQYVGEKHARNFLKDERMRNRAREPNALADHEIMRLAMEEYCEQVLVEDELSVRAFVGKLNPRDIYEACKRLRRGGDVDAQLPYFEDLKRAEAALYKAQSILGDYGSAFELDLVRSELAVLLDVFLAIFKEVAENSPETYTPAFNARTGRLTREGRAQWQQRCDEFLQQTQPITRLIEYMVDKVERYPRELREVRLLLLDFDERIRQMVRSVKKARRRTHA